MRDYIRALHERIDVDSHPYFEALRDGSFSRDDFVETQVQFFFAVTFFCRPMTVLAGRLPVAEWRLRLLENVGDEHGNGDLSRAHENTFLTLLDRLGVPREEVEARALWPEVRAFNTCLAGVCQQDDLYTALGTLGIIEDLFSGISARHSKWIVERGFLQADQMIHYDLHAELDEDHAEDFYGILDRPYAENPRHAYQVQQGLELGAYIFLRLYRDLYEARGRRVRREVRGAHTSAGGWG